MNNISKKEGETNQSRMLARAKKIADNQSLSKDELAKEYAALLQEYEALLKESGKPTRTGSQPPVQTDTRPDQSEEITEMKSRLLSHITHEFLTPLNLIITPLEQMLAKSRSQEQKKNLLPDASK